MYKDNSRSSRELVDESKSYADQEQDSVFAADCLIKRVSSTPDAIASTKKSMPLMSSTLSGHTSSMEPNDQTMSSVRCSPRNEWAQLIDRGPKVINMKTNIYFPLLVILHNFYLFIYFNYFGPS